MTIMTCWPVAAVVDRILKVHAAPEVTPWMWTLVFGHHEDRSPTHGYAATRDAAVAAFAKNWRRDDWRVFLYAFDLIELDGDDLQRNVPDEDGILDFITGPERAEKESQPSDLSLA